MTVVPDETPKRPLGTQDPTKSAKQDPEEPPPSYSPQPKPAASGSVLSNTFKTKPTNFLTLSGRDAIRGEFVIDPSIVIPSSVLPPLGEDETEDDRKNLCLESTFSSVHADIWLLGGEPAKDGTYIPDRRTTIALSTGHGSISSQVQSLDGAAPFSLTARAPHGSIRLAIPRSFQGMLSVSTHHGSISLSDALVQNATQLSQLDTTRRYFVGDFSMLGEDAWQGDQVELDSTHGSIRVKYVDELPGAQGKKGLFGRLFGG